MVSLFSSYGDCLIHTSLESQWLHIVYARHYYERNWISACMPILEVPEVPVMGYTASINGFGAAGVNNYSLMGLCLKNNQVSAGNRYSKSGCVNLISLKVVEVFHFLRPLFSLCLNGAEHWYWMQPCMYFVEERVSCDNL